MISDILALCSSNRSLSRWRSGSSSVISTNCCVVLAKTSPALSDSCMLLAQRSIATVSLGNWDMKSCLVLLCSKSLLAAFGMSRSLVRMTSPVIRRLYVGLPKKGSRYRRSEMENPNFFSNSPRSLTSFIVARASLTQTQAKPNSWLLDPLISKNAGA